MIDKATLSTYFDRTWTVFVKYYNTVTSTYNGYQNVNQIENMVNRLLSLGKIDYGFGYALNEAIAAHKRINDPGEDLDALNRTRDIALTLINEKLAVH